MKLQIEEFTERIVTRLIEPWAVTTLKRQIVFGSAAKKFIGITEGRKFHLSYKDEIIYLLNPINDKNLLFVKKLGKYELGINAHTLLFRLDIPIEARYIISEYKDDNYTGYKLELYELM